MEPTIVSKPGFTVVGMMYSGRNARKIPKLWRTFGPRIEEIAHLADPEISYGLTTGYDEKKHRFDYVACVEVRSTDAIPEGMVSWEVPERTYAVFTCTLPTFIKAYRRVKEKWIPENGYEFAGYPEFERYDEHFDPDDKGSVLEFYIPVRQATEGTT